MPRPKPSRVREQRIIDEIVVDAYTSDERAMGWHCYLEDKLEFPFQARCALHRAISPLIEGEAVEVIGMAPADDCMRDVFVLVRYSARTLGVPLSQLEAIGASGETREAVEDWRYWSTMGYEF